MKAKKVISLLLATAMTSGCLFSTTSCSILDNIKDIISGILSPTPPPADDVIKDFTPYGNQTTTSVVKNPSMDVKIKLIRGKNVLDTATDELRYNKALQAGDIIELESDYCYLNVNLFENLGEQLIYSPTGQFTFQVPSSALQATYPSGTFSGSNHVFTASVAADSSLKNESNLALNAYDYMYVDEVNDQTVTSMAATLKDSAAETLKQVTAYPHAYANRVTRNEVGFFARNAIDGRTESNGHGNSYPSWGYDQKSDAEYVVYFGREVTLNTLGIVLRADYAVSGGKEHDTYWEEATVEFSDGSCETLTFEKSGDVQTFDLDGVTTSSIRIKEITSVTGNHTEGYAALTELQAYGTENVHENPVATKTSITTTFGGKERGHFTTNDYSYQEIKNTMDKANAWFINKTESTNYQIPDYNGNPMTVKINDAGWKDAVYYSGLSEAFFTTGDMDSYYFLRAVGEQFDYLNNNGKHTPHGDFYQIGETYLMLNDLRMTNYKTADSFANLDYNLARDWETKTPPSGLGLDSSRDWSHMGFWWCDALYMAMNSYTLATLQTGDAKYVEKAFAGYQFWKNELYNSTYNLWHRDSTQFTVYTNLKDNQGNKVPTFWSRGNAWVLAALAKQMMYLDETQFPEIYASYKADFLELAESIAQYQREDGTWNASIVDGSYYGGMETTGTCGFIYAYCIGMDLGILDPDVYYPIVSSAYDCVVNECMFESGQVGYMQTTGYQPQNYKSEAYSKENTHEFGMGLFLLASSGMMRICSDYETPTVIIPADPQSALIG